MTSDIDGRVQTFKFGSVRLADCHKFDVLGAAYELVFVVSTAPCDFWAPAIVIPSCDYDDLMPRPSGPDEFVVKYFETGQYGCVARQDLVELHPSKEPYHTFRAYVPRLCQARSMRLALDWHRYRKLPLYFRWSKFTDTAAPAKGVSSDDHLPIPRKVGRPPNSSLSVDRAAGPTSYMRILPAPPPQPLLNKNLFDNFYSAANFGGGGAPLTSRIHPVPVPLPQQTGQPVREQSFHSVATESNAMAEEQMRAAQPNAVIPRIPGVLEVDKFELFKAVWNRGGWTGMKPEDWYAVAQSMFPGHSIIGLEDLIRQLYQRNLIEVEAKYRMQQNHLTVKAAQPPPSPVVTSIVVSEDGPTAKRQKTEAGSQMPKTKNATCPPNKKSPPRKQRAYSLSALKPSPPGPKADKQPIAPLPLPVAVPSKELASEKILPVANDKVDPPDVEDCLDVVNVADEVSDVSTQPTSSIPAVDTLSSKTRILSILKGHGEAKGNQNSPPMAPPDCPLNAVAKWHRSILKRRMSAPALPISIPVDHSKINLDNVEFVIEQLDVLEERLARRSLHYWNDYGFGRDRPISPAPNDPFDVRDLQKLREWSQNLFKPEINKTSSILRRDRGSSNNGGKRRRRIEEDEESDESAASDNEFDQFLPGLEAPEVMLQKEQELNLFLMRFGPTAFLDEEGRDITDSNDVSNNVHIAKMIDAQEQQISALQQRFSSLKNGLRTVREDIKRVKSDRKQLGGKTSTLKLDMLSGNLKSSKQQQPESTSHSEDCTAAPSLVASKQFGSDTSLTADTNQPHHIFSHPMPIVGMED